MFIWYFTGMYILSKSVIDARVLKFAGRFFIGFLALILSACSSLSYYGQAIRGQFELLGKRVPITSVLAGDKLDKNIRQKLLTVQEARDFSISNLGMPDNDSYCDYADLKRRYVMWNVFVTPAFSFTPMEWCYPIVGCIAYRSYFSRVDAQKLANEMEASGYDVYLSAIPAYSTLGWFSDPVTSTMMHWQDYDLVGTLFHELAHQMFYIKNDTVFNESLAKAIEQEGLRRWMEYKGKGERYQAYLLDDRREDLLVKIVLKARKKLEVLYSQGDSKKISLSSKLEIFRLLRKDYYQLRKQWGGYDGYDQWILSGMNNAKIQSIATYYDYVPAFNQLLKKQGGDLSLFYKQIKKLMAKDIQSRKRILGVQ
ncbi:MAG: aminopeptidase [Gammaproteobacteria bacterium]|nr:aminopeptidase [Gammaproteobacteria bacterium]